MFKMMKTTGASTARLKILIPPTHALPHQIRHANASTTPRLQSETIAMTLRLIFLLFVFCLLPLAGSAATLQTLEIQLSFDTAAIQDKTVDGYQLYQDGILACETDALPTDTSITCDNISAEGGSTHSYELAARFSDQTYSAKSEPAFIFTFPVDTVGSLPPEPSTGTGAYLVHYSWEAVSDSGIMGYRMYLNDTAVCETPDPFATELSCYADLVDTTMNFSLVSFDASGTESTKSNFLTLDPTDYPEFFQKKKTTFTWEYTDSASSSGGFQLYSNGELLCQTSDPAARSLTCTIEILQPEHTFTLMAVSSAGDLTTFSNSIVYTSVSSPSEPPVTSEPLAAVITPQTTSGPIPFAVTFSATGSTGNITSYNWDFGDGDKGTGLTASHTYAIAGTYSATLAITDATGNIALTTASITAEQAISQPTPPTAVISSSSATGEAPLSVTFDASGSTATSSTLVSYNWDFGDGSQGTGKTATHTFTIAGTYNTELRVTDSLGLTDTETTPVIVTAATIINQKPSASFSATPTQGSSPLTVSFDASASNDSDGTIASFIWNFGDGSAGSGKTVQHTYTAAATYTAVLQVTDDKGATSAPVSKTIIAEEAKPDITLNYEIGELALTNEWVRVKLENTFINPAIFVSPPTNNDREAVITRVRNLDKSGFEIRLQEWEYLDGKHHEEAVSFLALEQGQTTLPDGTIIEVGRFNGSTRSQTLTFKQAFSATPVVLTTVVSENETDAVVGRVSAVTAKSFAYLLQEKESTKSKHVNESVCYLALSPGSGDVDNIHFAAVIPTTTVTNNLTTVPFKEPFQQVPFLFTEQQTMNGVDTAALRIQNLSTDNVQLFLQEDQSKDIEVNHVAETIGYLGITSTIVESAGLERNITFTWEFDSSLENTIQGFRIYHNDQMLCETTSSSERMITCKSQTAATNIFNIVAVDLSGTETSPSNNILYNQ